MVLKNTQVIFACNGIPNRAKHLPRRMKYVQQRTSLARAIKNLKRIDVAQKRFKLIPQYLGNLQHGQQRNQLPEIP